MLREKIQHFDHERIPERIVHARGSAAHGFFELTDSLADVTTARILTEVGARTEVFVRFSTVAGGAGSVDTPRDVRGFAVKFYTEVCAFRYSESAVSCGFRRSSAGMMCPYGGLASGASS